MSDLLNNILEKFKKVDGGYLDPDRSGADGAEDDFIGKHIDNVDTHDAPVVKDGHPHTPKNPKEMAPRKKHRKGYEPGEDEEVYESTDFIDILTLKEMMNVSDIDGEDILESLSLEEANEFFFQLVDEAIEEYYEEEADEEERAIIEELTSTPEGYQELFFDLLEAKDEDDEEDDDDDDDEEDDDDEDEDDEDVDVNPKLKKTKMGEEIERRADVKMVKVKTPEGKVVYRKQKPETEVSKHSD